MSLVVQSNKENNKWCAEFNLSGPGDMHFKFNNKELFRAGGVELGMLKEENGIEKICRSHFSEKTEWQWVETETLNPFGSEPVIKRKWEQAGNHFKVVTDIIVRATTPMEHMTVDSLFLSGNWKGVTVYTQKNPETSEFDIINIDLSDFSGKEVKFEHIPLVMLFRSDDGVLLEVGTGYDLWRWHQTAENLQGRTDFALIGTDEGVSLERKVVSWDGEFDLERNNFRYSWYFAWGKTFKPALEKFEAVKLTPEGKKLVAGNKENTNMFCLDSLNWPDSATVKGIKHKQPCFCSRQTGNYLKAWFRSLCNKLESSDNNIYLCDLDIHICSNSSHMLRGKKNNLIHCDYFYLLGFWEWANKYLGDSNFKFKMIFDENSVFANLPSVKGLNE